MPPAGSLLMDTPTVPSQTIELTNPGDGTFTWTASWSQPWLSVTPTSGDTTDETDTLTATVDPEGLTAGVYNDTITVTSPQAVNSPITIPVTFNVTGGVAPVPLPLSPSSAQATGSLVISATPYDRAVDEDFPISHWKMGGTGAAIDRMGVTDLPAVGGTPALSTGIVKDSGDEARVLTTAQSFGLADATGIGVPYDTATWTIEAWVRLDAPSLTGADAYIWQRDGSQALFIEPTAGSWRYNLIVYEPSALIGWDAPSSFGQSHHVVGLYDGTDIILYVDDVEVVRDVLPAARALPANPDKAPKIGGGNFDGAIDEVVFYGQGVAAGQIDKHHKAGKKGLVVPDPSSGVGTGALTLSIPAAAPVVVPLLPGNSVATAVLAVQAPARVTLSASAVAGGTFVMRAPSLLGFQTGSSVATATVALTAPARVTMVASAIASATVALRAPASLPFNPGTAVAQGSVGLRAPPLLTLSGAASASAIQIALAAPSRLPLAISSASASGTLVLVGVPRLSLIGAASASASMVLVGPAVIAASATATGTGTLALVGPAVVTASSTATATGALGFIIGIYPAEVLADNPSGYWRLGDLTDSSGHGFTLAQTGTVTDEPDLIAVEPIPALTTDQVREFDGINDIIRLVAPSYWATAPITIVAVVRRYVTTNYQGIFAIGPAGSASPYVVFEFEPGNTIEYVNQAGLGYHAHTSDIRFSSTDWQLVAFGIDGSAPSKGLWFRFHSFDGTSWFHDTDFPGVSLDGTWDTTAPSDWSSFSDMELRFGNWNSSFNWFDGNIAMVALHVGSSLSNSEMEALAGGNRDDYVAAGFDHLWELNQPNTVTPVEDYIGSSDQIDSVGTTVVPATAPPSSIYNLGSTEMAIGGAKRFETHYLQDGLYHDHNELLTHDSACSVEAWVEVSFVGAHYNIVQKHYSYYLSLEDTGKFSCTFHTDAGYWPGDGTTSVELGKTYHVVGTWDGTNSRIYVNGEFEGENRFGTAIGIPVIQPTRSMYIGADFHGSSHGWWGVIDEVAIYDHALTPERILAHYLAGAPSAATELPLDPSSAQATGSLALVGVPQLALTGSATGTASLALVGPAVVSGSASATATASLALTTGVAAPAILPFDTAPATATASLALRAPAYLSLTASGLGTASLALTGPAVVTASASAQATAALALKAPARFTLSSSGAGTGSLAVQAPVQVPLGAVSAQATGALALIGVAQVVATGVATGTGTLALLSRTYIPLNAAPATATASLNLGTGVAAPAVLPLTFSSVIGTGSLALLAQPRIALQASSSVGTASLNLLAPARLGLQSASSTGTASLALLAPAQVTLQAGAAVATASLDLVGPAVISAVGVATGTGSLVLGTGAAAPAIIPLSLSQATATASLSISAATFLGVIGSASATASVALRAPALITASGSGSAIATLALVAPGKLVMAGSAAATGTLSLVGRPVVVATGVAQATGVLSLFVITVPLIAATGSAQATATLALIRPTVQFITAVGSAQATSALALQAPSYLTATASATATATFALRAAVRPALAPSTASASALLAVTIPQPLALVGSASGTSSLVIFGRPSLTLTGTASANASLSLLLRANLIFSATGSAQGALSLFVPTVVPATLPLAPSVGHASGLISLQTVPRLALAGTAQGFSTLVVISPSVLGKHTRLLLEVPERGVNLVTIIVENGLHLLVNDPGTPMPITADINERPIAVAVTEYS